MKKMLLRKKLMIALAVVMVITSFSLGVFSKGLVEKIEAELRGDFTIVIDGKKQNFKDVNGNEVEPILYDGTTYLPVRAIAEIMGKKVYWYQDDKRIEIVEPKDEEIIVTDADVIIADEADKKDKVEKDKVEKPEKAEKPKKAEENVKIKLEKAKAIALDKAGLKEKDVKFEEAKLDFDDGRWVYDIDFWHERVEYSFEIDAQSGTIIEWEKDID